MPIEPAAPPAGVVDGASVTPAAALEIASSPIASDLVVAIDAGHGERDPGTRSARGRPEYAFNHRLAEELALALEAAGVRRVVRVNDGALHGREGLQARTRIAQEANADLLLSIHHDSVQERYLEPWVVEGRTERYTEAWRGYSLFVARESEAFAGGFEAARAIGDALLARGFEPTLHHAEEIPGEGRELLDPERGIYNAPFWVVRTAAMPAVLIEAGVLLNREEESDLDDPLYRRRLVEAIIEGVLAVVGTESRE